MGNGPQIVENVITDLPSRASVLPLRLAAIYRLSWRILKACAELYGIGCFLGWLLEIANLI